MCWCCWCCCWGCCWLLLVGVGVVVVVGTWSFDVDVAFMVGKFLELLKQPQPNKTYSLKGLLGVLWGKKPQQTQQFEKLHTDPYHILGPSSVFLAKRTQGWSSLRTFFSQRQAPWSTYKNDLPLAPVKSMKQQMVKSAKIIIVSE